MKYLPYVTIVAIALLALTGFLVDEGGQIESRQAALTIAQGAARAGTDAASGSAINGDAFQLSNTTAVQAARAYIEAAGPDTTGTVQVSGNEISVTVHRTYETRFAFWVGVPRLDCVGVAAARLIDGA